MPDPKCSIPYGVGVFSLAYPKKESEKKYLFNESTIQVRILVAKDSTLAIKSDR